MVNHGWAWLSMVNDTTVCIMVNYRLYIDSTWYMDSPSDFQLVSGRRQQVKGVSSLLHALIPIWSQHAVSTSHITHHPSSRNSATPQLNSRDLSPDHPPVFLMPQQIKLTYGSSKFTLQSWCTKMSRYQAHRCLSVSLWVRPEREVRCRASRRPVSTRENAARKARRKTRSALVQVRLTRQFGQLRIKNGRICKMERTESPLFGLHTSHTPKLSSKTKLQHHFHDLHASFLEALLFPNRHPAFCWWGERRKRIAASAASHLSSDRNPKDWTPGDNCWLCARSWDILVLWKISGSVLGPLGPLHRLERSTVKTQRFDFCFCRFVWCLNHSTSNYKRPLNCICFIMIIMINARLFNLDALQVFESQSWLTCTNINLTSTCNLTTWYMWHT